MRDIPEHPLIARCLRTGYPYPIRDDDEEEDDEYEDDDEYDD